MITLASYLVLFFAISVASTSAATLESKEKARQLTDNVVSKIATGDFEAGLKLMAPYVIVPQSEFDASIEAAKFQWPALEVRFGTPVGYEFICENESGKSVYKIIQIVKYEKHIARFIFIFYKPKDSWVLNTYNFDDQIQGLFCN